jgi:hypothetical protein
VLVDLKSGKLDFISSDFVNKCFWSSILFTTEVDGFKRICASKKSRNIYHVKCDVLLSGDGCRRVVIIRRVHLVVITHFAALNVPQVEEDDTGASAGYTDPSVLTSPVSIPSRGNIHLYSSYAAAAIIK